VVKAYFKGDLSTELSTILAVAGDYPMRNRGYSPKYLKEKNCNYGNLPKTQKALNH